MSRSQQTNQRTMLGDNNYVPKYTYVVLGARSFAILERLEFSNTRQGHVASTRSEHQAKTLVDKLNQLTER